MFIYSFRQLRTLNYIKNTLLNCLQWAKLTMLSGWERWHILSLSPVHHSDKKQL